MQSLSICVTYLQGCVTEDPIRHLYKYEDDLQSGIGSATQFLEKADEIGIDDLSSQCGADVSPIIEGIGLIKDNLGILLGALRYVHSFLLLIGTASFLSHSNYSLLQQINVRVGKL